MSGQEREQSRADSAEQEVDETEVASSVEGEEITEKIDDILDEIDTVLEENAEEFVKNYVQKGGE